MSTIVQSKRKAERTSSTIRTQSIFGGLPKSVQDQLTSGGRRVKFSDGKIVQHRGDDSSSFFAIIKGQIKLGRYDENGEMRAMIMLAEGDGFGEMACLGNFPRIADGEAVGEVELIEISEKKFTGALLASPELSREVMRVLSRQLQEAMDNLIIYQKLPAPLRLVRALLMMCEDRKAPFDLAIRHQELAELVGVSRMSIAKTLEQLEQLKFLERGYRQISITDVTGLKLWMQAQMSF
jgi:CRP/FNR family transcriptional regulator, cyclic AMP receptor protein